MRLQEEFHTIASLVAGKVTRSNGNAEMASILLENIQQIQDVITAWKAICETENGNIPPEIFQTTFSTSNLRVIDPLLAEVYRKQSKKRRNALLIRRQKKQRNPKAPRHSSRAPKKLRKRKFRKPPSSLQRSRQKSAELAEVFSRKNTFAELRSIGFFQ